MPLRAILFDLDDTLHDKSATLRAVAARQYTSADLHRFRVAPEAWVSRFLELNNERIEKTEVFARLADTFDLRQSVQNELLHDFDTNLGKMARPFPKAIELLQACRSRGLKLGVVTNGRDGFQRSKTVGMGVHTLLDSVVTSGGFGSKKPDQRIFLACLKELDVSPQDAAFVGDDFEADMEPSLALGMVAIWKNEGRSERVAFCSDELDQIHAYLRSVA